MARLRIRRSASAGVSASSRRAACGSPCRTSRCRPPAGGCAAPECARAARRRAGLVVVGPGAAIVAGRPPDQALAQAADRRRVLLDGRADHPGRQHEPERAEHHGRSQQREPPGARDEQDHQRHDRDQHLGDGAGQRREPEQEPGQPEEGQPVAAQRRHQRRQRPDGQRHEQRLGHDGVLGEDQPAVERDQQPRADPDDPPEPGRREPRRPRANVSPAVTIPERVLEEDQRAESSPPPRSRTLPATGRPASAWRPGRTRTPGPARSRAPGTPRCRRPQRLARGRGTRRARAPRPPAPAAAPRGQGAAAPSREPPQPFEGAMNRAPTSAAFEGRNSSRPQVSRPHPPRPPPPAPEVVAPTGRRSSCSRSLWERAGVRAGPPAADDPRLAAPPATTATRRSPSAPRSPDRLGSDTAPGPFKAALAPISSVTQAPTSSPGLPGRQQATPRPRARTAPAAAEPRGPAARA